MISRVVTLFVISSLIGIIGFTIAQWKNIKKQISSSASICFVVKNWKKEQEAGRQAGRHTKYKSIKIL